MRLINTDSFRIAKHIPTGDVPYDQGIEDGIAHVLEAMSDAPTIDAIPVGWLIDRANDPERAPLYRRYAQMLYEEWQKEQGRY